MALVAEVKDSRAGGHDIVAVGRLSKLHGLNEAEVALLVNDQFQHRGLGTELFERLIEIARQEKLDHIIAEILPENRDMLRISEKLGFRLYRTIDDPTVKAILDLNSLPSPSLT